MKKREDEKYKTYATLAPEADPIMRVIAGDRAINDLAHFAVDGSPYLQLSDSDRLQTLKNFLSNEESDYKNIRNIVVAISHTKSLDTIISAMKALIENQKPEFCAILNVQLYKLCFKNNRLFFQSLTTLRVHAHTHNCPGFISLIKSLIMINAINLTDVLSTEELKIYDQSFWAAQNNNVAQLRAVCDQLPSVNVPPDYTALHHAASEGSIVCAEYLVGRGADVNHPSLQGMTPIFDAARKGHTAMVTFLLDHEADVNYISATGYTPLCAAVMSNAETVELLLSHGAELEIHGRTGYTSLLFAVTAQNVSTTRQLLQRGANPNHLAHGDQKTPLQIAIEQKDQSLAILLIQYGADLYHILPNGQTLFNLAQQHKLDTQALAQASLQSMNLQQLSMKSFLNYRNSLVTQIRNPGMRPENIPLSELLRQRDKLLNNSQKLPDSLTSTNPDLCSIPHHWLQCTLHNFLKKYSPFDLETNILVKLEHAIISSDSICQKFISTILADCNPSIISARLYDKLLAPLNALLLDASHTNMSPSVLRARALVIFYSYEPTGQESSLVLQLQKMCQKASDELPKTLHALVSQKSMQELSSQLKENLRRPLIQMIKDYNSRMETYKEVISVKMN